MIIWLINRCQAVTVNIYLNIVNFNSTWVSTLTHMDVLFEVEWSHSQSCQGFFQAMITALDIRVVLLSKNKTTFGQPFHGMILPDLTTFNHNNKGCLKRAKKTLTFAQLERSLAVASLRPVRGSSLLAASWRNCGPMNACASTKIAWVQTQAWKSC